MTKRSLILTLVSIVLVAPFAPCESPVELKEVGRVSVPNQKADAFVDPIKCDSNSDIYLQVLQGSDDFRRNPVMRISPDGKSALFPARGSKTGELGIIDFAPARARGVDLLVTDYRTGYYLESLNERGEPQSKFSLPAWIEPMQIAVSPSGKVLISGLLSGSGAGGLNPSRAFTGVFDATGKLEQEVPLPDDIEPDGLPLSDEGRYRQALSLSYAQFSDNGDFVLARLRSGGPIHLISPAGVDLDGGFHPAIPDGAYLSSVKVDGDTLAAMSVKKIPDSTRNEISDVFISLWDIQTGREIGEFHHSSPRLGSAFACYKAGVFTFLSTDLNSEVQLVSAVGSQ